MSTNETKHSLLAGYGNLPSDLLSVIYEYLLLLDLLKGERVCQLWRRHLQLTQEPWRVAFLNREDWKRFVPSGLGAAWRLAVKSRLKNQQQWFEGKCSKQMLLHGPDFNVLRYCGQQLATGGRDSIIKLWDLETIKMKKLCGHFGEIYSLEMDGERIYSGAYDQAVKIWDMKTRIALQTLVSHDGPVTSLLLSRDQETKSSYLYSGSRDCRILEWDLERMTAITTFRGHILGIRGIRLADRRLIGAAGNVIKLWDVTSGKCISTLTVTASVTGLDLGKYLVDCRSDRSISLWDISLSHPSLVRTLEGHSSTVLSVAIDGKRVISGSLDRTIKIWNAENGKCMTTLKGHGSGVVSLQCDDKRLISGETYGDIKLWNFI